MLWLHKVAEPIIHYSFTNYHGFIRHFLRIFSGWLHKERIKLLLYKRANRCYDLVIIEIGNESHSGQMKPASNRGGFLCWAQLQEIAMFERQIQHEVLVCPDCSGKLLPERELLICNQHGAFFMYGPQLLVRASRPATKPAEPSMPWESARARLA